MNNNSNTTNTQNTNPYLRGGQQMFEGKGNGVAYSLVGTPIRISGKKGRVFVQDGKVKTGYHRGSEFVMEHVEIVQNKKSKTSGNQRLVAFRLKDTNLYLSQNPYGNEARAETLKSISSLPILPEISSEIVDFVVGGGKTDVEGEGFDDRSVQLEQGPPGLLQQFTLEGQGLRKVGIKSVYGKYWRAPTWSDTILQSPHQQSDEDFAFDGVQPRH